MEYEKTIYISHIFQNKEENTKKIEEIVRKLTKIYPTYRFVSPVHCFGYLYNDMSYEDGLALSMSLLEICNELWYEPSEESKGVKAEVDYCLKYGIPVATIQSKLNYRQLPETVKFIRIKYFDPDIPRIENIEGKSDWFDLRSSVDINMNKGDFKLIPLGIGMIIPAGYEANIVPRSSTFKKWGILQTNCFAVIDNSYSGDNDQWMLPVYATRDTSIKKGDRICQFRINKKQPETYFEVVEHLNSTDRGGFGSTGTT